MVIPRGIEPGRIDGAPGRRERGMPSSGNAYRFAGCVSSRSSITGIREAWRRRIVGAASGGGSFATRPGGGTFVARCEGAGASYASRSGARSTGATAATGRRVGARSGSSTCVPAAGATGSSLARRESWGFDRSVGRGGGASDSPSASRSPASPSTSPSAAGGSGGAMRASLRVFAAVAFVVARFFVCWAGSGEALSGTVTARPVRLRGGAGSASTVVARAEFGPRARFGRTAFFAAAASSGAVLRSESFRFEPGGAVLPLSTRIA